MIAISEDGGTSWTTSTLADGGCWPLNEAHDLSTWWGDYEGIDVDPVSSLFYAAWGDRRSMEDTSVYLGLVGP